MPSKPFYLDDLANLPPPNHFASPRFEDDLDRLLDGHRFPSESLPGLTEAIEKLPDGLDRIRASVAVALLSQDSEKKALLGKALESARLLPIDNAEGGDGFGGFAPPTLAMLLAGELVERIYWFSRGSDGCERARGLALIAPHLPEQERLSVMRELVDAVLGIKNNPLARTQALISLLPRLELELRNALVPTLIKSLDDISQPWVRANVRWDAASILPKLYRDQVLQEGRSVLQELANANDQQKDILSLVELHDRYARYSQETRLTLIEQAVILARRIPDAAKKAECLLILSRWYEGDTYESLLQESTALIDTLETGSLKAWASKRLDLWTQDLLVPWHLAKADRMDVARNIAMAAGLIYFKRVSQRNRKASQPAPDTDLVPRAKALNANQIVAMRDAQLDE
jgi:hypothetical protein